MSHFIIVGTDYSGLGWATRLAQEGEQVHYAHSFDDEDASPEDIARFNMVGKGIVPTLTIDDAVRQFADSDVYWVFDSNHCSDVSEELRAGGRKVFGACELSERAEHDRAWAIEEAAAGGLGLADMQEFKTPQEGLAYLKSHEDTAYVFKPNDSHLNYMTFVPTHDDDRIVNETLQTYLENLKEATPKGYILQERKKGVEANFEVWMTAGVPWLATCGLESKRILNADKGEHCGCAQDIMFTVPLECKGIQQSVMKVIDVYAAAKYTGFLDVNVIIADDQMWFLENCNRFGYSAHPNFFSTILMDDTGAFLADWIDGKPMDPSRFRKGFGASVNLYTEHPRAGWPIIISEKAARNYFPYDLYREDGKYLLAGYSGDVGVVTAHGYTIQDATEATLDTLKRHRVWFPDCGYRTDLAGRDYPSSPCKRYEALAAMGLLNV